MVRLRAVLPAILFITALGLSTPVSAQEGSTICDDPDIGCCGDLTLILLNPDLQPGGDGFIHASGNLFVQFQAIGDAADQIETFGFSFGAYTTDFPEDVCELPSGAWFSGQQLINYRADTDPSDGFFINLQTPLVPDGQYTAAVHAYDGDNNELARFWASAIVDNCDTPTDPAGQVERCDGDTEQNQRVDSTQPWPIVLPGDGLTTADVQGFTLEFAEKLANLTVSLNGEDVTDQLETWEGRLWDDDLLPGYGPNGLNNILVPECSQQPPQECSTLGVAYKWTQRALTESDVLRVEAEDMGGNLASKDLHVGAGVTSGAITEAVPILTWSVDRVTADLAAGEPGLFRFTIQNSGGETGHPFAGQAGPSEWDYAWSPSHVPVASGSQEAQEFVITPSEGTPPGDYPITAYMNYTQGGQPKTLEQVLSVTVLEPVGGFVAEPEDAGPDEEQDTPWPLLPGLVALGLLAGRRRGL